MTPADMIARLDRQLATKGQTIVLRRLSGTGPTWSEVTLRGRIYGHGQNELMGSTKQTMQSFVLSPTLLNAAVAAGAWPPVPGEPLIRKNDELRGADGVSRRIESLSSEAPQDVIVRYDGQVLG